MIRRAMLALVLVVSTGCTETVEREQVCRRAPDLESALVAVDESLSALDRMRPRLLQSSLAVLSGTLEVWTEVAPSALLEPVQTVRQAYRNLDSALASVFYDGSVASSDAEVTRVVLALRSNETLTALERIRRYVSERCTDDLSYQPPPDGLTGSTLPAPSSNPEPEDDVAAGFDDESSAVRAYGRLVVESLGREVSDEMAFCVGAGLTDAALDDPVDTAAHFDRILAALLMQCEGSVVSVDD